MDIPKLIEKAGSSKFQLWKLNNILWMGIPFNKPHRFKIVEIRKGYAKIDIPFRKTNKNHIKTLHACSMATCAEYTSGLVIGTFFDFKKYRLIMKEIRMEYHYQGKMKAYCEYEITEAKFNELLEQLDSADSIFHESVVSCIDIEGNLLSTGYVKWQIKPWSKTRS